MKIKEALQKAKEKADFPAVKILLTFHLKKSFEEIFLLQDEDLEREEDFFSLIQAYSSSVPLEYLTKEAYFNGEKFFVDERVLIPRDESELLLFQAQKVLKNIAKPRICEVGTGSGILAISLAKDFPEAEIFATDISKEALEVATINAKNFKVEDRITFVHCSYFDEVEGNFDLILSNPPYIQNNIKLDENVLKEPHLALFGGEFGHEILEELIKKAKDRTKFLLCEIGFDQRAILEKILFEQAFEAEFYKDLASWDRGFLAQRIEK